MSWEFVFYNRRTFESIKELPSKLRARFLVLMEEMMQRGPDLGMPHTRAMGDGLFEIRAKAQEGIARGLYCTLVNQRIVILHSFVKKTEKTPQKELELARQRLKEIMRHEKHTLYQP